MLTVTSSLMPLFQSIIWLMRLRLAAAHLGVEFPKTLRSIGRRGS